MAAEAAADARGFGGFQAQVFFKWELVLRQVFHALLLFL